MNESKNYARNDSVSDQTSFVNTILIANQVELGGITLLSNMLNACWWSKKKRREETKVSHDTSEIVHFEKTYIFAVCILTHNSKILT